MLKSADAPWCSGRTADAGVHVGVLSLGSHKSTSAIMSANEQSSDHRAGTGTHPGVRFGIHVKLIAAERGEGVKHGVGASAARRWD